VSGRVGLPSDLLPIRCFADLCRLLESAANPAIRGSDTPPADYSAIRDDSLAVRPRLSMLLWGVVRIDAALDMYSFHGFMILVPLLAVPVGRIGLAPSFLARNRHG
jgi:hypothetical protein